MSDNLPLVSIICPSYNHGKYIGQALEGFVMQKATFPFEIVVHDDASTDNTVSIIKSYEEKYPGLFSNIYQQENQFSKSIHNISKHTFAKARGKYIALCEGDDYWTDPYKLQKQVDFLQKNEECIICFTRGIINNEFSQIGNVSSAIDQIVELDIPDFIEANNQLTATCIFRRHDHFSFPAWFSQSPFGDWALYLHLMHTYKKKAFCLPDITTVYRIHGSGMHGNLHASNEKLISAYKLHLSFYRIIKKNLLAKQYRKLINQAIYEKVGIISALYCNEAEIIKGMQINIRYALNAPSIRSFLARLFSLQKLYVRKLVYQK